MKVIDICPNCKMNLVYSDHHHKLRCGSCGFLDRRNGFFTMPANKERRQINNNPYETGTDPDPWGHVPIHRNR